MTNKFRANCFIRTLGAGILGSLCLILAGATLRATTINVEVENSDRILFSGGTARPTTDLNARIGQGFVTPNEASDYVLPFKLPSLPDHERIVSAALVVNLEGWSNFSGFLRNLDIFGINVISPTNNADMPGNYVNGVNPSSNVEAFLLQDNFLTPADINTTSAASQVISKQSLDIGAYVQNLYDGGALAGEYAFFTMAHDAVVPEGQMRYYLLTSGNNTNTALRPKMVITTGGTEFGGAYYYLDPGSTNTVENGTASAPWKSFTAAQANLHAGDVIYCTGEMGPVTMLNTYPAGTASLVNGVSVEKWITYTKWPGKTQPHITKLAFSGGPKRDWYIAFVDFKFSPGYELDANYTLNNAIKLDGAWYVKFNECLIEGAELQVPEKPADSNATYGVDRTKGFFPYTPLVSSTPPAITAGVPGNASHITINECKITNCAIGIMVSEDYRQSPKEAKHWTITNNTITNTSEDAIRIGGGGASGTSAKPSQISGNKISDQSTYKQAFIWAGDGDPAIWNSHKWEQVRQDYQITVNGILTSVYSTAVIYHAVALPNGPMGELRTKVFLLADDNGHVPNRSRKERWYLVSQPSLLYLDPTYVDTATNTLKPNVGESAHTDCISIMGATHDVVFARNNVNIDEAGGPLKVEGIKNTNPAVSGHPYNITFENNLFYSYGDAGGGIILAGGWNILFKHNVIYCGPDGPVTATRFNKTSKDEDLIEYGITFDNNIIGGGGDVNWFNTALGVYEDGRNNPSGIVHKKFARTFNNIWLSPPDEGYNDYESQGPGTGFLGSGDKVVAGWAAVKFHDPRGPLDDNGLPDDGIPDLSLDPGSPAINLLHPRIEGQTTDNKDITGYTRDDGFPDAGAYEVHTP